MVEGVRCFILTRVVMVHTCCIQLDLMLVPRPRVDVGADWYNNQISLPWVYSCILSLDSSEATGIETFQFYPLCVYSQTEDQRNLPLLLLRRSFYVTP